jgi:hypothetical protein
MISLWTLGLLLYLGCCLGLAFLAGFNDHPPARGLLRRSQSPNPPPRL